MALSRKKRNGTAAVAAAAACILLAGGTGTAYAANVGGIQRTIQLWIHGDQTDATIEFNPDSTYTISYPDENGNAVERGGGVWVYYYDQRLDITDKFDDDGVCYVKLRKTDETLYLTVKYQNGYSYSSKKYVSPVEFN